MNKNSINSNNYLNNSKIGRAQVQLTFSDKYENNVITVYFNIVDDGSMDPSTIGYQLSVNAKNSFKGRYLEGENVSISANNTESQTFNKWAVVKGNISLSESQLRENPLTFNMPASDVEIKAGYIGKSLRDEISAENSRYNSILLRAKQLESTIQLYFDTITRIYEKYGYNSDEYNLALEEFQPKINQAQAELDSIDLEEESIIHDNNIAEICQRHFVKNSSVAEIDYINFNEDEYDYTGAPIRPTVTVIDSTGKELGNESYEVVYPSDCTSAGDHEITLNLKGDYTGTKKKTFTIVKHQYGEWIVKKEPTCTETGERERRCIDCGKIAKEVIPITHCWDSKYTIDKEATCSSKGSESIHCVKCDAIKEYSTRDIPIRAHSFSAWTTTKTATEISVGEETQICKICGHSEKHEISMLTPTLPTVKITKPKAAKKSATIKWKKVSKKNLKKIKKVEIQYSADKNFMNDVKIKYVGAKKTSYKIKGLQKGKTYYVRLRAYANAGGVVHVSKWSSPKKVEAK